MKVAAAVIGSGNIGTDLMFKIMRQSDTLEMGMMVGIDPDSDGLRRAASLGIATTSEGIDGLLNWDGFEDIQVVFDATSASAHRHNAEKLAPFNKKIIDLTPAAIGPFVVPSVNLEENLASDNLNMVTCGGQATVPLVAAVGNTAPVLYAEIVASIASKSAGPGTRANIDEFTETTSKALETVGGAATGKAIIVLNPAEPPRMMRDTVLLITKKLSDSQQAQIERDIEARVDEIANYVPGYRLKQQVQFEELDRAADTLVPEDVQADAYTKISVFIEVEGAAMYLPAYAGNLDIMTSAAMRVGEQVVARSTSVI
jgi:acetaldehyde dehydrogenase